VSPGVFRAKGGRWILGGVREGGGGGEGLGRREMGGKRKAGQELIPRRV
jgi:hypothetical protein